MPFPEKLQLRGTSYRPNWKFKDAVIEKSNGTRLTLRFFSTSPNLLLESVWEANRVWDQLKTAVSIKNNSGEIIEFQDSDVISANLDITADSTITLWRFNKGRYLGNKDPRDKPVVSTNQIGANNNFVSYLSNDGNGSSPEGINSHLPFQMLDVNSKHGLYIGYEWSFGVFKNQTGADPLKVSYITGSRFIPVLS